MSRVTVVQKKRKTLLNDHLGTKCSISTIQGIVVSYLYKIDCVEAKADPPPPRWYFFFGGGCEFKMHNMHYYTLIVVNMQCVQYVSYSLSISLHKHIWYVWRGIKTIADPKNFTRDRPPVFWNSWVSHWDVWYRYIWGSKCRCYI